MASDWMGYAFTAIVAFFVGIWAYETLSSYSPALRARIIEKWAERSTRLNLARARTNRDLDTALRADGDLLTEEAKSRMEGANG